MKFIDECEIELKAGKGGDGIVSFRREARVARGGPNGGNGGNGGSIYFVGSTGTNTLLSFKFRKSIIGNDGVNGKRNNQTGANGKDIYIKVPLGTVVWKNDKIICDVIEENKNYLIAKGGKGGRGNESFKSSRNTAPRLSENGTKGEHFKIKLELRLVADVGLIGKPSVGKSTLLSKLSNVKPKIADYPFTTLVPQLGLVAVSNANEKSFIIADLPGLIEGASVGKGLGLQFLRHINRCKIVLHIVDCDKNNAISDYLEIRNELKKYSDVLAKRKEIVAANKSDCENYKNNLLKFKQHFPKIKVFEISALKDLGLNKLKTYLYKESQKAKDIILETTNDDEIFISLENEGPEIVVTKKFEGMFEVEGLLVKQIYDKIPLNTQANTRRFLIQLKNIGVWTELQKLNVKNNDTVRIFNYEFEWLEEDI